MPVHNHRIAAKPSLRSTESTLLNESELSELATDLRAYVSGRRDSARESTLLRRVRALPRSQRLAVLTPLLELNPRTALVFIDRAQLAPSDYLAIFKLGLVKGDSSSVAVWMKATVPHLGWHKVFSVLRETLNTNPHKGASALYHVPYICGSNAPQPLTPELTLEYARLVVRYHENGHDAVPEGTVDRLKEALWDHNFHKYDSDGCVFVGFKLSWEDWQESRQIRKTGKKALEQYQSDYLSFGAETRQFTANDFGWTYKSSSGIARHEWKELFGVAYHERVIMLMATGCHYALSRSAFNEAQLTKLMRWVERAMGKVRG